MPVFAWALLDGRPTLALVVFATAAISDLVDGLLARWLEQHTAIGAVLDPLADKLLGLVALVLLVRQGALPPWLLGCSVLRDAVVLGVALGVRFTGRAMPAEPTRISKYATFWLLIAVVLALGSMDGAVAPSARPYAAVAGLVAAQCLLVATLQYAQRARALVGSPPAGPRLG